MFNQMEIKKLIDITQNAENKSNKDLYDVRNLLYDEYEKTKELIINLTEHLEKIEFAYNNVNNEIEKRLKK